MPDPSRKHSTNQAGTRAEHARQPDHMADFAGSIACPWRSVGMPRCPPSPGSKGRADRPARQHEGADHDPGSRQLRRQPHRPPRAAAHREWDRPGHVPSGGVGSAGAGAVVLHLDRVARPGRARRAVPRQGQPSGGRGPAPAAELDRRGWQRPVHRRGRGRGAGPSLRWATATTTRAPRTYRILGVWLTGWWLASAGRAGFWVPRRQHRCYREGRSVAGGRSQSDAWVGWTVWSTVASSSAARASRSTSSRRRAANASSVRAAS
jgi:hypothetical protein